MDDLATGPPEGVDVVRARAADAAEVMVLQRCCWVGEAVLNDTLEVPALHEDLAEVQQWIEQRDVWLLRRSGRLIGAVRAHLDGDRWEIGRLMVAPDCAGRGLGRWLLRHAEMQAPPAAAEVVLFTGARSRRNLRMYQRAGFELAEPPSVGLGQHIQGAVYLRKAAPSHLEPPHEW